MTAPRRPPCRCERLAFPHRRDWRCEEFADALPEARYLGPRGCADDDTIAADELDRARDCRTAAQGR